MQTLLKRFIDCNVPTQTCNMKCPYCYIGQVDGFSGKIKEIGHTPEEVRNALSKKRMGGTVFINFCATGETLLGEEILPIIHAVLEEGHYAQIVTNGTIDKRFDEIASWNKELLDRLMVKFSFHYTELKRLNKLESFFGNIIKVWKAGSSFSLEITPWDEMVPYIDEMKQISMEKLGALPHVTVARNTNTPELRMLTKYTPEEYNKIWGTFDSPLFDLKMRLFSERRTEYCYGGEWTFYLNLQSGDIRQCYKGDIIDNIYADATQTLHFKPIGNGCREHYCFNGHAWMTLGSIPNMKLPTYADMRNRVTVSKEEWLTDTYKSFMSQRLEDNNIVYENLTAVPKILMLGDSISLGYREKVENKLSDKADIYFPNDNVKYSVNLLRYINEWAEQMKIGSNIDVVYFNVGLWDVLRISGDAPLVSLEEYAQNLRRIIERLKYLFCNAKIIFATTTTVDEALMKYSLSRYNVDIDRYNKMACQIMADMNVAVHDLNFVSKKELQDKYVDFTHFTEEGYDILAEEVAGYLTGVLAVLERNEKSLLSKVKDKMVTDDFSVLYNRRIIVYGAGDYGDKLISYLNSKGKEVALACDASEKKQGTKIRGINIVSPSEYMEKYMDVEKDIVVVAIGNKNIVKNVLSNFLQVDGLDVCTLGAFREIE